MMIAYWCGSTNNQIDSYPFIKSMKTFNIGMPKGHETICLKILDYVVDMVTII